MIQNNGISFGIRLPGVILITGLVLLGISYVAIRQKEWRWSLVILGGVLNLVERINYGFVTDYWKIPFVPIYNNVNDWLIFVGVILLIWKYCTKIKKS